MPSRARTNYIPPDYFHHQLEAALNDAQISDLEKISARQSMLLEYNQDPNKFMSEFDEYLTPACRSEIRKQASGVFSVLEKSYVQFARTMVIATVNYLSTAIIRQAIPANPDRDSKRLFMNKIFVCGDLTDQQVEILYDYTTTLIGEKP